MIKWNGAHWSKSEFLQIKKSSVDIYFFYDVKQDKNDNDVILEFFTRLYFFCF